MALRRISSCFCSWVRATTSSRAISSSSSSSALAASLSPAPLPPATLGVPSRPPATDEAASSPPPPPAAAAAAAAAAALLCLLLRPRFFLGCPLAVSPLTWLPLTWDMVSTEGERTAGERASGGNDVWRSGCEGAPTPEPVCEGLRRFGGAAWMSRVDERFLLGSWAGVGFGGDMAEGEPAPGGGDAMVCVGGREMMAVVGWSWMAAAIQA